MRHLRTNHFLIFLSPEFTAFRTCSGRVLVVTIKSKDPNGVDIAPTGLCFSRLGTGPIWPSMRLVTFSWGAYSAMLIKLYSKCYNSMLLILQSSTNMIVIAGWPPPRVSGCLTGTGLPIASRLVKLFHCKMSISSRLTVGRLLFRTHCTSTLSILSINPSHLLGGLGGRRSGIRIIQTARTRPPMSES